MEKASAIFGSIFGGAAAEPAATVSSIFVYPIKSCRGISVSEAPITSTGLRWDRQWVVINSKGRAYTQRVEPKLALVEVELPQNAFVEGWEPTNSSYLASETRAVDPAYAHGYNTMFSDGYPFLLLSQGSLNALNELLREPLSVNRFRPNILVDGCDPFLEDLWTEIKINKLTFNGVKLCSRCKVPTINQENGIAGPEPTETLMKFRSDKVLLPGRKHQGKVFFGQNLVCRESLTQGKGKAIKVGDPVYITKKVSSSADAAA
ncbi:PREDICTED: mitochondrial amidoxime-reducing component 1 isoform X4 [Nelumbo nucifera]|uniref:Mitochondrial amidoxime-reducing component 1 isoform X4 n=1 Tax=Nelumbo nucifera TaxID=4432 RepID=A0A1U8AEL8_NELNU|nr:PREDICTED: mitochondrial amidoxime-reducing component 1 isoform X4 [Nelumbo nucifera]